VRSPAEVNAAWQTFYQLLYELKAEHQPLHLSLSGGRRMLALLAASVAMLHFYPTDHVWHLYTPPEITERARDGAMMHVSAEAGVHLIEVPLMPWGAYFPGVRPLLDLSPQAQRSLPTGWLDDAERARCEQVWRALTPGQQAVLRLLAQHLTRKQVAERLVIEVSTVDSHRKAIA
jgi:CRISPR-associated protein Csx14